MLFRSGHIALNKIAEESIVTEALIQRIKTAFEKEIADKTAKADRSSIDWASDAREWVERTTGLPFRTEKDHIWEYGGMLDHALRRVSIAHSWAKRAEASRQEFQDAADQPTDTAVSAWVAEYCAQREQSSGALGEYLIRKNALDGWKEVCLAWHGLGASAGADDRVKAARDLQDEVEKFGDIQLFEALAAADVSVWSRAGGVAPELLSREVAKRIARHDQTRFKVPAYRHPDGNAFIERLYRTLKEEAVWPNDFMNYNEALDAISVWVIDYNTERPHEALGMKTPAELYTASPRPYQGLPDPHYPFHDKTVVVTCCGRPCLYRKKINLSKSLAGQAEIGRAHV